MKRIAIISLYISAKEEENRKRHDNAGKQPGLPLAFQPPQHTTKWPRRSYPISQRERAKPDPRALSHAGLYFEPAAGVFNALVRVSKYKRRSISTHAPAVIARSREIGREMSSYSSPALYLESLFMPARSGVGELARARRNGTELRGCV